MLIKHHASTCERECLRTTGPNHDCFQHGSHDRHIGTPLNDNVGADVPGKIPLPDEDLCRGEWSDGAGSLEQVLDLLAIGVEIDCRAYSDRRFLIEIAKAECDCEVKVLGGKIPNGRIDGHIYFLTH